jgi:glycosyltransferase involved in cell wall biosynthesis
MTIPLVSVSMVTYNQAHYISQAIECVLRQKTDFPFELVIGEDCSTDGTREIVFEYQRKYPDVIVVITSDSNVGATENGMRTTGACRGKYIAMCDGDDYWHHPYKLQKQVDYLERHPKCGMVFSDYDIYFNKTGKTLRSINNNRGFQSPMNLTIEQAIGPEGGIIRTCTIVFRKDLCEKVRKEDPYLHENEDFLMGDVQFFAELILLSEVSYYPESLATYRIVDESATRSKDLSKTERFMKSLCEMKMYLCDKHKLSETIRRKEELKWYDCSLRLAFHTGNAELAEEVLSKKKTLTWEEWLLYYGAKHSILYSPFRLAAIFRSLLRKTVEYP